MIKEVLMCGCGCKDFIVSREHPYSEMKFTCPKCGYVANGKDFEEVKNVWNYHQTPVVATDNVLVTDLLEEHYKCYKETNGTKNNVERFLQFHNITKMSELQTKYQVQGIAGLHDVPGCGACVANVFLDLLTQYEKIQGI